jgi:hypothetical protein
MANYNDPKTGKTVKAINLEHAKSKLNVAEKTKSESKTKAKTKSKPKIETEKD